MPNISILSGVLISEILELNYMKSYMVVKLQQATLRQVPLFCTVLFLYRLFIVKFNINPFWTSLENPKKTKKEASKFETSSEMVAGAGFEPTTFGL